LLRNNFYTVLSADETGSKNVESKDGKQLIYTIKLDENHPVYKGHFPGNPVVPGVCQVQIIGELFSEIIGKEASLIRSDNIKFMNMIDPRLNPVLNITIIYCGREENLWDVTSTISGKDLLFLKFKGKYLS